MTTIVKRDVISSDIIYARDEDSCGAVREAGVPRAGSRRFEGRGSVH